MSCANTYTNPCYPLYFGTGYKRFEERVKAIARKEIFIILKEVLKEYYTAKQIDDVLEKLLEKMGEQSFSGSYNDLTDKPELFSGSYNDLSDKPTLFSGSYNDLTDVPAIPTKVSDLTNDNNYLTEHQDISGKANVSELSRVAFSGSYNDLTDTPIIPVIPNIDYNQLIADVTNIQSDITVIKTKLWDINYTDIETLNINNN